MRVARRRLGISQTDLAALCGVTQGTISKLEAADESGNPSWELLTNLCHHLQLRPEAFVKRQEEVQPWVHPFRYAFGRASHHLLLMGSTDRFAAALFWVLCDLQTVRPEVVGLSVIRMDARDDYGNAIATRHISSHYGFIPVANPNTIKRWREGKMWSRAPEERHILRGSYEPVWVIDIPVSFGLIGFGLSDMLDQDDCHSLKLLAETMATVIAFIHKDSQTPVTTTIKAKTIEEKLDELQAAVDKLTDS
tara:strand:- start:53 stop:802 length:750 start_codon:yes stop_codon:yes gene_type:complete